jgi:hypothetical protein
MVICTALALGACTDGEVTAPDPLPLTTARLAQATVGVQDLPDDFAQQTAAPGIAAPVVDDHRCDDILETLEPADEVTSAASDGTQTLVSVVARFPGGGGVAEQAFRQAQQTCRSVSTPGGEAAIRAGPLDFGVLSDDTLAIVFEVETLQGRITETAVVVIRRGDLVSVLRLTGPRPVSRTVLDQSTRVAIGRISELAQTTET